MKYVFQNALGYYKFCRKIPNSQKQFVFSLKTKNAKQAKKIVSAFLIKSTPYFLYLENLTKEDIVVRFDEIRHILEDYKQEALKEYSTLEKARHAHLTFEKRDGAHPESAEHWIAEFREHIVANRTLKQTQELVRQILKRTTMPLKSFYQSIKDDEEKMVFMQMLIKTESDLLKIDYERAKEYFDLGHHMETKKHQEIVKIVKKAVDEKIDTVALQDFTNDKSVVDKAQYKTKNKNAVFEEYMSTHKLKKKADTDKVIYSIQTLLQSSEAEFLIDYTEEDYELFMFSLAYTPAYMSRLKTIFESPQYNGNFVAIARDFENGSLTSTQYNLELQSFKTLQEKLSAVKSFLAFCVGPKRKYLDYNILDTKDPDLEYKFTSLYFEDIAKESLSRTPYKTEELEKMFEVMEKNGFFKHSNIAYFYIPMIGLFSGMRLEEICKLKTKDIIVEQRIPCFNITPPAKTKSSIRAVPIHSYLLNDLNFMDYVKSRENEEYLFNIKRKVVKGKVKHSHEYGQEYSVFRQNFVSENRIKEDLVSFHSFRHTFATRLNSSKVQEIQISKLLGHLVKAVNETPRYIHGEVPQLKEDVEILYLKDLKVALKKLSAKFQKIQ